MKIGIEDTHLLLEVKQLIEQGKQQIVYTLCRELSWLHLRLVKENKI